MQFCLFLGSFFSKEPLMEQLLGTSLQSWTVPGATLSALIAMTNLAGTSNEPCNRSNQPRESTSIPPAWSSKHSTTQASPLEFFFRFYALYLSFMKHVTDPTSPGNQPQYLLHEVQSTQLLKLVHRSFFLGSMLCICLFYVWNIWEKALTMKLIFVFKEEWFCK